MMVKNGKRFEQEENGGCRDGLRRKKEEGPSPC